MNPRDNTKTTSVRQSLIKKQLLQSYTDALVDFEKRYSAGWQMELKSVHEEISPYAKREHLTENR